MEKPLCIALATTGLLATSLFIGVIAGNAEAAPSTTASTSSVIGAHDGTTLTSAADHFARIRTQERSAAKGLDTNTDAAVPDHPAWGVFTSNVPMTGQQAYNSVAAGYTFSSDTLYAPTMKAPNSCIEMVAAYNGGHTPQVWAWDWDLVRFNRCSQVGKYRFNLRCQLHREEKWARFLPRQAGANQRQQQHLVGAIIQCAHAKMGHPLHPKRLRSGRYQPKLEHL
ncbi:hypothetical membrane protein [Renibacterium salmoninarum ATCC 33209]|uniref:Hypothetical membrane protein n=1 Tax=Renibacterium salmoninarum (strain ATCC 33209 / DSM 20767 / JCM 11484 / NBRC 15589 / NCIMB 2235) TaxID=288705 RepID=A9WQ82_RENSM|nr:hypothetical protein [Renibacterium salmoninarum]ABY22522.1 hypothetical membrane protein [Renibacterium salmoninarum ATCC 33209]